MLKHASEEGHLTWDCPNCREEKTVHVSHEGVWHSAPETVMLPACDCGSSMGLNVSELTEEDLAPPILTRDEQGRIIRVDIQGAPNLTDTRQQHTELTRGPDGRTMPITIYDQVIHPVPWVTHHAVLREHMVKHGKPYKKPEPVPAPKLIVPENFVALTHAEQLHWAMEAIYQLARQQGVDVVHSKSSPPPPSSSSSEGETTTEQKAWMLQETIKLTQAQGGIHVLQLSPDEEDEEEDGDDDEEEIETSPLQGEGTH